MNHPTGQLCLMPPYAICLYVVYDYDVLFFPLSPSDRVCFSFLPSQFLPYLNPNSRPSCCLRALFATIKFRNFTPKIPAELSRGSGDFRELHELLL
jgi:hypothetical protein